MEAKRPSIARVLYNLSSRIPLRLLLSLLLCILDDHFDILFGQIGITLEGQAEATDFQFSRNGILKGVRTYDNNDSWFAHAIRLFEIE